MRIVIKAALVATWLVVLCSSCTRRKDPDLVPEPTTSANSDGGVKLEFFNKVGSANLVLDNDIQASPRYVNANGDSFSVAKFNYYISNVKLLRTAGMYVEPESYHLVQDIIDSSKNFSIGNVPPGQYTGITFLIGVDSLHNVSGAQSGALDPALGMFWDWNTGYIMWKFEGHSPSSQQVDKSVVFHGGGYKGFGIALREVTLMFPSPITVTSTATNHVHITADLDVLFRAPNVIDFHTDYFATIPGKICGQLSDNFANLFSVTYAGL